MSTTRKRRAVWFGIIVLVPSFGLAYACGFPEVNFGPAPPAGDGGSDGDVPDDDASEGSRDGSVTFDAPGADAPTTARDASRLDASSTMCPGAVNTCDCDNDGFLDGKRDACAGNDCDDRDDLRHPNQVYVTEPLDPDQDGNWDCVAPIEKQYTINLKCDQLVLGLNCNAGAQGFLGDPACGALTDFYHCKAGTLACVEEKEAVQRRQGCK